MRIEELEDHTKVWVRQSWLNDVLICPERARLAVRLPEWRQGSDATHIGTAVHKGIEHYLGGGTVKEGYTVADTELTRLMDEEPYKINSTNGPAHMREYVQKLMETFERDIMREVVPGGQVEAKFGVKLFDIPTIDMFGMPSTDPQTKPTEVWLGGTMDYVDPNGLVWDWKTAGRKYSQREKQLQSIQATAYSYASVEMGWAPGYPVRFNYGVMTRANTSVGQIVPIIRTASHIDWFKHQVDSIVQPFVKLGLETPWMTNDQHFLCSEKWCTYWSICKGSRISEFNNNNTQEITQ
jgi:hypothetical protein